MTQDDNALYFVPLGGSGEIGMNLNLYGFGPEDSLSLGLYVLSPVDDLKY